MPDIFAVGNAFTTTVADPLAVLTHAVLLDSCTFSNAYTNVPLEDVGAAIETEFPTVVVIVRNAPPLMR